MTWRFGGWPPGRDHYRAIPSVSGTCRAGALFVQALALCQAAGMVRWPGPLDGTKVRANASKRKG